MSFKKTLFSIALIFCTVGAASAQELHVAAAADLNFALPEIAKAFEAQTGTKVLISFGSSGNFFAQIQSGAPFDVFCSADMGYPQKLAAAGQALPETLRQYASGRLVLWVPSGSKLNFERDGIKVLLDPSVKKIAIANPEHAPYGRAAVAALQKAGIYESVKAKLVYGENISQAAEFVQSGNAQAGIVALSLAVSPAMKNGNRWEIPANNYPPIKQAVVLLEASNNKAAARGFLEFVSGPQGRQILERFGFTVPTP